MSGIKSPSGLNLKAFAFYGFRGLDASRDKTGLDTGKAQALTKIDNAYCDWRGQIVREPGADRRGNDDVVVEHIDFFGRDLAAWAQRSGGGHLTLNSDRGHQNLDVFPPGANTSTTTFNSKLHFASAGQRMQSYDGLVWRQNTSALADGPANIATSVRRLWASGMPGLPTEIHASRVDDENVMPGDESALAVDPERAAFIDIVNLIGTADQITGHAEFESNRLAIFTNDQVIIYIVNADLTKWALDDRANIHVGCLSHRTICMAGSDLMFASRNGVHSLRRSVQNAIQLYSVPLSDRVDQLWRTLVKSVPDPASISAVWDQDYGQYHIFFPSSPVLSTRLTYTANPIDPDAGKWSTGSFLQARCAGFLGGRLVYGTPGGLFDVRTIADTDTDVEPTAVIETPVLWHGSLSDTKESHSLILHVTGQGTVKVEAHNENGQLIDGFNLTIDQPQDDVWPDRPLSRQYERKFSHRYRGLQLRFTLMGEGLCRIIGFAVNIVMPPDKGK